MGGLPSAHGSQGTAGGQDDYIENRMWKTRPEDRGNIGQEQIRDTDFEPEPTRGTVVPNQMRMRALIDEIVRNRPAQPRPPAQQVPISVPVVAGGRSSLKPIIQKVTVTPKSWGGQETPEEKN